MRVEFVSLVLYVRLLLVLLGLWLWLVGGELVEGSCWRNWLKQREREERRNLSPSLDTYGHNRIGTPNLSVESILPQVPRRLAIFSTYVQTVPFF